MHVSELTEKDRVQGLISDHFIIQDEKVVPTNYGIACMLNNQMGQYMARLLDEQAPPSKEDIRYFLETSLKIRRYLMAHAEKFYVTQEKPARIPE